VVFGLSPQSGVAIPGPVQQIVVPAVDEVAVSVLEVVVQVNAPPPDVARFGGELSSVTVCVDVVAHPFGAVAVAVNVPDWVTTCVFGLAPQSGDAIPGPVQHIVAPAVAEVAVKVLDVVVQVNAPPPDVARSGVPASRVTTCVEVFTHPLGPVAVAVNVPD